MGKGDRKSRRGKLWRGSHGKLRPKYKSPAAITEPPKGKSKKKKKT